MHENVSPTDPPTTVVYYPRTGHTSMMIGRVRFWPVRRGMVVEGLPEVDGYCRKRGGDQQDGNSERLETWYPDLPNPYARRAFTPRLFGHHHHYLDVNTWARRPTRADGVP